MALEHVMIFHANLNKEIAGGAAAVAAFLASTPARPLPRPRPSEPAPADPTAVLPAVVPEKD